MEIFLVRHADALDAEQGMSDDQRPLSSEGVERMRKGAAGLANILKDHGTPALNGILSSPKVRAVETARILAWELNGSETVISCPPLAGDFTWNDLLPYLKQFPPHARVALVGHEPALGLLAGYLISGTDRTSIFLKKGSAICFQLDPSSSSPSPAELLWFLTPRQMRMLR
jgi:phosphohistidine phosphatase